MMKEALVVCASATKGIRPKKHWYAVDMEVKCIYDSEFGDCD